MRAASFIGDDVSEHVADRAAPFSGDDVSVPVAMRAAPFIGDDVSVPAAMRAAPFSGDDVSVLVSLRAAPFIGDDVSVPVAMRAAPFSGDDVSVPVADRAAPFIGDDVSEHVADRAAPFSGDDVNDVASLESTLLQSTRKQRECRRKKTSKIKNAQNEALESALALKADIDAAADAEAIRQSGRYVQWFQSDIYNNDIMWVKHKDKAYNYVLDKRNGERVVKFVRYSLDGGGWSDFTAIHEYMTVDYRGEESSERKIGNICLGDR
jgi:hypothetical protein